MYELKLENTADRHLGRILELQAEHNGDTVYLITDSQRITYAQANETTERLAAGFAAVGSGKGERVEVLGADPDASGEMGSASFDGIHSSGSESFSQISQGTAPFGASNQDTIGDSVVKPPPLPAAMQQATGATK